MLSSVLLAKPADQSYLTGRLAKTLDSVVDSHSQGDLVGVGKILLQRVVRLQAKQVAAFDAALSERELPSVGELLVSVRLTLDGQNRSSALPKMTSDERLLMLAADGQPQPTLTRSRLDTYEH